MQASEYQEKTKLFAVYPELQSLEYLGLGLASEAGEVAGKIKKWLRGDVGTHKDLTEAIKAEVGDVMWYVSELCNDLGLSLEDVMQYNIDKLSDRKARDKLKGSGDTR